MKKLFDMLHRKSETSKEDSDFSYFFSLLVFGEALTKIVTLITNAALNKDENRHQYRVLYSLVRSNGIGDWSKAIDDMLIGTASQHLNHDFSAHQKQLSDKLIESDWRNIAVSSIIKALDIFEIDTRSIPPKKDLKLWFRLFSELRNATRGHGSLPIEKASQAAPYLANGIELIISNATIFQCPFAYLKRNLNGKYRVTPLNDNADIFNSLKKSDNVHIPDGVYVYIDGYKRIPLMESDPDISDFYISNGGFNATKFELISYFSDCRISGDSSRYNDPIGRLPPSESKGIGELAPMGTCFSNVPSITYTYIKRDELEQKLYELLIDDRRSVVTLLGRGGIGKTSLALRVIPRLYEIEKYSAIIWLSSRDVDLSISGPKIVCADVVTVKDISKYFAKLVVSEAKREEKGFNAIEYFQTQLTNSEIGPCLFVFDNFETTDSPIELYKWLDTFIRPPNKILITTRLREFVGDYPLTVSGMSYEESIELIRSTWTSLKKDSQLSQDVLDDIYSKSSGHPYIIKIILGTLAKNSGIKSIEKIIAGSDEILTALFERTFAAMNPCAQRIYLTLSDWNSAIPRLAAESVLMNSIDDPLEVEKAIDTLIQYSIIEEIKSEHDGQYFIGLPYVARSFGQKKISVSPIRSAISNDVRVLRTFGPSKLDDAHLSIRKSIIQFLKAINQTYECFIQNEKILDRICLGYNEANMLVATWLFELRDEGSLNSAKEYLKKYIQNNRNNESNVNAWKMLAEIYAINSEHMEQAHALIEVSLYKEVEFCELSNIANHINRMFNSKELIVENHDVKNELLIRFVQVLWNRRSEGNAIDYSRIAWLALHINDQDRALMLVDEGLKVDPCNEYCIKLKSKLERRAV